MKTLFIYTTVLGVLATVFVSAANTAVDFIFNPSSHIELDQQATYGCFVNDTRVTIAWNINGTGELPDGITKTGTTTNSTLTIPGQMRFNHTVVRCIASGVELVDGTGYFNFSDSTLLLQGVLESPTNLACVAYNAVIRCNWNAPFSLTNIFNYVVNITSDYDTVQSLSINSYFNHTLPYYGNYNISVAGNNTLGPGTFSELQIVNVIPSGNLTDSQVSFNYSLYKGRWNVNFTFKNGSLFHLSPLHINANLSTINNNISSINKLVDGNGKHEGTNLIQWIDLGLIPNNTHWKLTICLIYPSFKICTQPTSFSTFDVRRGSWSPDSTVIGRVYFTCYFVEGSTSGGCLVRYICNQTKNGNITINRTSSSNEDSATGYLDDINTSTYTISYYDLDDTDTPAYNLTGQNITGIDPQTTTTMSSSFSSNTPSITLSTSSTPSPTEGNTAIIIGVTVPVGVIVVFIMIVAVLVVITSCILQRNNNRGSCDFKKKEIKNSQKESYKGDTNKNILDRQISTDSNKVDFKNTLGLYYISVGSGAATDNHPLKPLSGDNRVPPYSDIVPSHKDTSMGPVYDTANAHTSPLPHSTDGFLYHQLNHGTQSPHQVNNEGKYNALNCNNGASTVAISADSEYSTISNNNNNVHTTSAFNNDSNYSTLNKSEQKPLPNSKELTQADLTALIPHLSTKWFELGIALAITPDVLDEMKENRQGISDVFIQWEEGKTRPFTWDTLITILKSTTVNEPQLAIELEKEIH